MPERGNQKDRRRGVTRLGPGRRQGCPALHETLREDRRKSIDIVDEFCPVGMLQTGQLIGMRVHPGEIAEGARGIVLLVADLRQFRIGQTRFAMREAGDIDAFQPRTQFGEKRCVVLALTAPGLRPCSERTAAFWINGKRLLRPRDRVIQFAETLIGRRRDGLDARRHLVEPRHRGVTIAERVAEPSRIARRRGRAHIGGRRVRRQFDQPLELGNGLRILRALLIELATIEEDVGIVGLDRLGAVIGQQCLIRLALIALGIAEIDPDIDMARHPRGRRGNQLFRLSGIALAERNEPQKMQGIRIFRLAFQNGRRRNPGMVEPPGREVRAAKLQ